MLGSSQAPVGSRLRQFIVRWDSWSVTLAQNQGYFFSHLICIPFKTELHDAMKHEKSMGRRAGRAGRDHRDYVLYRVTWSTGEFPFIRGHGIICPDRGRN